ncbi:MAG: DUF2382 domain-containing protein [Mycobacteriales bacterium]
MNGDGRPSEEQPRVDDEREQQRLAREQLDAVGARKQVDVERATQRAERGTEHADVDRHPVTDPATDSGRVETLPDGSLSIPVFEEQLVVTKRLIVRERVVVRKHTVYEEHEVSADLRRESLEIDSGRDAGGGGTWR